MSCCDHPDPYGRSSHGTGTVGIWNQYLFLALDEEQPINDYDPATINNDSTIGGYSRLATLIQQRKKELQRMGPVLVLDAGDYSDSEPRAYPSPERLHRLRCHA